MAYFISNYKIIITWYYNIVFDHVLWRTEGERIADTGITLKIRIHTKGGDICMCMADSFCCAVEANTTL